MENNTQEIIDSPESNYIENDLDDEYADGKWREWQPKILSNREFSRRKFLHWTGTAVVALPVINWGGLLVPGAEAIYKRSQIDDKEVSDHFKPDQEKTEADTGIDFIIDKNLEGDLEEKAIKAIEHLSSIPKSILKKCRVNIIYLRKHLGESMDGNAAISDIPFDIDINLLIRDDELVNHNTIFHEVIHCFTLRNPVTEYGIIGTFQTKSLFTPSELGEWEEITRSIGGYDENYKNNEARRGFGESASINRLELIGNPPRYGTQNLREDIATVGAWVLESIFEEKNIFHLMKEKEYFREDEILQKKIRLFCDSYYRILKECHPSEIKPIHERFFTYYETEKKLGEGQTRRGFVAGLFGLRRS